MRKLKIKATGKKFIMKNMKQRGQNKYLSVYQTGEGGGQCTAPQVTVTVSSANSCFESQTGK